MTSHDDVDKILSSGEDEAYTSAVTIPIQFGVSLGSPPPPHFTEKTKYPISPIFEYVCLAFIVLMYCACRDIRRVPTRALHLVRSLPGRVQPKASQPTAREQHGYTP